MEGNNCKKLFINFDTNELHIIGEEYVLIQSFDTLLEEKVFGYESIEEYNLIFKISKVALRSVMKIHKNE